MRLVTELRRSAAVAATLSFVLPGLGQGWAGAVRRGLLLLVPIVALGAIAGGLWLEEPVLLFGLLLQPRVLAFLAVINAALFAYRSYAVVDAYRLARRRCPSRSGLLRRSLSALVVGGLLGAVAATHGVIAYADYQAYSLVTTVFRPSGPSEGFGGLGMGNAPDASTPAETPLPATAWPTASPPPSGSGGGAPVRTVPPDPTPTPSPAPPPDWTADGRLDLLLVGSDAGPDRWSLRTDTMILLSVDVASGRAALFGLPRNLVNVPLPAESAGAFPCRCFPGLLNALYVYATGHPDRFPGGDSRGFRAVAGAVAELTGVRLDGMVVVDLRGFVRLIDALGGLDIDVPYAVYDANYPIEDGSGHIVLSIRAGRQHMDGRLALAYARSRHQDSDYGRMQRQQIVLLALRRQVQPCSLLPRLPELLEIVKQSLWTTIPIDEVPGIMALGERVDPDAMTRVVFGPTRYPSILDAGAIARIRAVVAHVFDGPAPSPPPDETPLPGSAC